MINRRANKLWQVLLTCLFVTACLSGAARASAPEAQAAESPAAGEIFCVRPDGATYGRGDGSDWDNALSGLPDSRSNLWGEGAGKIGAGDTVLVAGGEYRRVWSAGAGGTADDRRLTIRRATEADHGPGGGWKKEFDAQVRLMGPAYFLLNGVSFVTLDGASESGFYTASDAPFGLSIRKCQNIIARYVRVDGSVNLDNYRGLDLRDSQNVRVEHSWISNTPNDNILMLGMKGCVIEHCRLGPRISPAPGNYGWHADLIEARNNVDVIFRFNQVEWAADGIFLFGGNVNWQIYGNIFRSGTENQAGKAVRTHSSNAANSRIAIHHNVFYRLNFGISCGSATTGEAYNNIFYQCLNFGFGGIGHDYNYFYDCGDKVVEEHKLTGGDPFIDAAKLDFRPKSDSAVIDAGKALDEGFQTDPAGTQRPQGKGWDVGAFEVAVEKE